MSNEARDGKLEMLESLLGRIQKNARAARPTALDFPSSSGSADPSLAAYKVKLAQARSATPPPVVARPNIGMRPVPSPVVQPTPKPMMPAIAASIPTPVVETSMPMPAAVVTQPTPKAVQVQPRAMQTPMPQATQVARPMQTPMPQATQVARPMQTPMPQATQVAAKAVPRTKTLLMGRPMSPEPTPPPPQTKSALIATPLPSLGVPLAMPVAPAMPEVPQVAGPRRSDSTPTLQAAAEAPPEAVAAYHRMHASDRAGDGAADRASDHQHTEASQIEPAKPIPIAPQRMVQISSPSPEPTSASQRSHEEDMEVTRAGYADDPRIAMMDPSPRIDAPIASRVEVGEPMAPPPSIPAMEPSPPAPFPKRMESAPPLLISQPLPPQHVAQPGGAAPSNREGRGWWLAAVVLLLFAAALYAAFHFGYLPLR